MVTETISLRLSQENRKIIGMAAEACGTTRTAFIVASAIGRAQDVLLDRTRLILNKDQWKAFMSILNGPVDAYAMKRAMETPPPWKE